MAKEKRNNASDNTVKKHATALVENMDGVLCDPPRDRSQHYGFACKVEAYPANTRIPYTAISYMWGSATETRDILVNGNPFQVTLNLYSLLEELAASTHKGLLWIDAICIDQRSISERNHQVALMDQIFSRADYVFVWLGLPTDNMVKACSILLDRNISEHLGKLKEAEGILEICEHPYWNRAWIVQEFVLALSIQICFGPYRIPLLRFDRVVNLVKYKTPAIQKTRALEVLEMRANWQQPSRAYYDPISATETLACSDPRDRIFAMVSLMDPRCKIKADYNLTSVQLFDRVVGPWDLDIKATETLAVKLDLNRTDRWRCEQPAWTRGRVSLGSGLRSAIYHRTKNHFGAGTKHHILAIPAGQVVDSKIPASLSHQSEDIDIEAPWDNETSESDLDEHDSKSILVYKYRSGAKGLETFTQEALSAKLDEDPELPFMRVTKKPIPRGASPFDIHREELYLPEEREQYAKKISPKSSIARIGLPDVAKWKHMVMGSYDDLAANSRKAQV